jgi:hypothetical protein
MPTRPAARKAPTRRAALARRAPTTRQAAAPTPPAGPPPGHTTFLLDVPFSDRAAAQAAGAAWDAHARAWAYTGPSLPAALHPYRSLPYSWERWQEEERNGTRPAPNPGTGDVTLRPHQLEATALGLQARQLGRSGFLLADEVGVGKTYAALNLALKTSARNVLVVCPLGVCAVWRAALARMGDGGKRFLVINYDRLHKLLEAPAAAADARKAATVRRMTARAGKPRVDFDLIIADEAHNLRNPATQRSRCVQRLAWRKDVFTVRLSATAGQNPLELSYLAPLLAESTGWKVAEMKDFGAWCKSIGLRVTKANGRWTWTRNDADLETMRGLLFDGAVPLGMRRRPEDIAGWPPIVRIVQPVELAPAAWRLYDEAWLTFRRELALARKGRNPVNQRVAFMRYRQKASLLRVPGTAEAAGELLDNGHQVAISCEWLESLEALRQELADRGVPCAVIRGGMPPADREHERLRFQRGEVRVVLFTPTEGFSLHQGEHNDAPRTTLVHDVRPSAIQAAQVEGRCHRDGRSSNAVYLYVEDSKEEVVVHRVLERMRAMKAMSGDDTETLEAILTDLFGDDDPA